MTDRIDFTDLNLVSEDENEEDEDGAENLWNFDNRKKLFSDTSCFVMKSKVVDRNSQRSEKKW